MQGTTSASALPVTGDPVLAAMIPIVQRQQLERTLQGLSKVEGEWRLHAMRKGNSPKGDREGPSIVAATKDSVILRFHHDGSFAECALRSINGRNGREIYDFLLGRLGRSSTPPNNDGPAPERSNDLATSGPSRTVAVVQSGKGFSKDPARIESLMAEFRKRHPAGTVLKRDALLLIGQFGGIAKGPGSAKIFLALAGKGYFTSVGDGKYRILPEGEDLPSGQQSGRTSSVDDPRERQLLVKARERLEGVDKKRKRIAEIDSLIQKNNARKTVIDELNAGLTTEREKLTSELPSEEKLAKLDQALAELGE